VWAMLHSGSRNVGNQTAMHHDKVAAQTGFPDPQGLNYMRIDSQEGQDYLKVQPARPLYPPRPPTKVEEQRENLSLRKPGEREKYFATFFEISHTKREKTFSEKTEKTWRKRKRKGSATFLLHLASSMPNAGHSSRWHCLKVRQSFCSA
jgi:hypothetical protein